MSDTWIQTYTGKQFWPLEPHKNEICVEDIAHSLSLLCRFNGHCKSFYSVAQHSVLVFRSLIESGVENTDNTRKMALLHDAAEAYMSDIPAPVKAELAGDILDLEFLIQMTIEEEFGIKPDPKMWQKIMHQDKVLLATEKRDLMVKEPASWGELPEPLVYDIAPWDCSYSERAWMMCWNGV